MRTLSLLRVKVSATTWLSPGRMQRLRQQRQFWILPLAVIGFGTLVALGLLILIQNYLSLYGLGAAAGRPELPIVAALIAGWAFVLVVIFPLAISLLYFSKDTSLLLTLPIPMRRIVAVNYLLLYGYALPVQLLVLGPAFVIYLIGQGASLGSVIAALLVTLSGPLPPLAVTILLVGGLAGVVNLGRHRVALEVAGMTLLVLVLLLFQVALSRSLAGSLGGAEPSQSMAALTATLGAFSNAIPPIRWAADATASPLLLLPFVAAGTLLTAGAAILLRYTLGRQVSRRSETASRRRADAARTGRRSPTRALLTRELSILGSNSTYLFEAIGEVAVLPIVLAVFALVTPADVISSVVPLLRGFSFTLPAVLGVLTLMAGFNTVAATAISREGRTISLSLSLPLSGWQQVRGKRACFFLLFGPAFVLNAVIAAFLLRLSWPDVLLLIAAGAPVINLVFDLSITADLRRPLLDWSHPQQAMKQNSNVFVSMGLVFLSVAAMGAIVVLCIAAGAGGALSVAAAGVAATAAGIGIRRPLRRYADRRYAASFSR